MKDMGGPEILGMISVYLTIDPDKHPAGQNCTILTTGQAWFGDLVTRCETALDRVPVLKAR